MDLQEITDKSHAMAVEKGWWDGGVENRNLGDQFANFHAEVSEAWEEYRRHGTEPEKFLYGGEDPFTTLEIPGELRERYEKEYAELVVCNGDALYMKKPEGIGPELADLFIRVCDTAGAYKVPLSRSVDVKMAYNALRGWRHGNKKA